MWSLRKTASALLQELFHQSKKTSDPETKKKTDIIKTAAKLIKSDIKSIEFSRSIYSSPATIASCEFQVSSAVLKDNDIEDGEHVSFLEETSGDMISETDIEDTENHSKTTFPQDLDELSSVFDEILERRVPVDTLDQNEILRKIRDSIYTFRKSHIEYRTARLWFLYMDMVDLLWKFITAERT
ncbi:unnamed protein product [Mytilus coruscus]|uniref:Uncharacterized protein n=1 Tax=Mytilus coruscus TaxID=42192 RepID=A0A6J8B7G0_MYTCO|nr:unnamed protein product [Mytilus coruscus]